MALTPEQLEHRKALYMAQGEKDRKTGKTYVDFGWVRDCAEDCRGWDGKSPRCDCLAVRVQWSEFCGDVFPEVI